MLVFNMDLIDNIAVLINRDLHDSNKVLVFSRDLIDSNNFVSNRDLIDSIKLSISRDLIDSINLVYSRDYYDINDVIYFQGLIPAMQEVMPGVHHRFCVMHLWRNFTKQWKDKELKGLVWECAKSTTEAQFKHNMERVKVKCQKAWEYLAKWPTESWTKAYFSEWPKVDNICNNTCEVFNAKIVKFRSKPILTMAEEIRCYIMKTMSTNKMKLAGRTGPLVPMQQSRLDREKLESNKWTPVWAGDADGMRFEVQKWQDKMDVNLTTHTCTCRFWQLTGQFGVVACCCLVMQLSVLFLFGLVAVWTGCCLDWFYSGILFYFVRTGLFLV